MKQSIMDFLNEDDRAKTLIEINDNLNLKSPEELKKLQNELNKLEEQGIVHQTKKGKYLLMKDCPSLRTGKIDISKNGYAFLIVPNGEDIFISKDNLNDALDGNTVLVDLFHRNNKIEGKVVKIINSSDNNSIAEVMVIDDKIKLKLKNNKNNIEINEVINNFSNIVDGHIVCVEIKKEKNKTIGIIKKIIGHKNDPKIDILSIAAKHGIDLEFSEEAKKELENIPDIVLEKDKIGRVDLTKDIIFTIDGDDTKDIDDAISLKYEGDIYELGVHIADVSYYIKEGTRLYDDAYKKGTSTYLADTVLPMLPHELSNGICSLNPGVERLSISCIMKINKEGKIIDYDIFPSYIISKIKMTYKNVNKILMENIVPDGYEDYQTILKEMHNLAKILRKRKVKDGYIEFDIPEPKIIQDESGKCIDVIKREQLEGEKLIEDFMIVANETVATHIYNMGIPFIYRVHGIPKEEKITDFLNMIKCLNIDINTKGVGTSSQGMQRILEKLNEYKEKEILSSMLLRSMQKAIYDVNNIGHFGLGLKNYTHFTSPIRRFPDTTVHRLLRTYIFNHDLSEETIKYFENYLIEVAEHSSEMEQASVDAEREVDDMKMAEYMESHIGEEYTGMITTVTNFGFFVQLPNLIEGLVHINTLKGFFNYVPELLSLINKSNNVKYRVGDIVNVKVINSNKETMMIDFEIVGDKNGNYKQESKI